MRTVDSPLQGLAVAAGLRNAIKSGNVHGRRPDDPYSTLAEQLLPFVTDPALMTREYTDENIRLLLSNLKPVEVKKDWVLNKHYLPEHHRRSAIYVGRGSAYGNDNRIGYDKHSRHTFSREDVIKMDIDDRVMWFTHPWRDGKINVKSLAKYIVDLRGKHVFCFCSPSACHGDWLTTLVNHDQPLEFLAEAIRERHKK